MKKWLKYLLIGVSVIIILVLTYGLSKWNFCLRCGDETFEEYDDCIDSLNEQDMIPDVDFVSGEMIVGFVDGVSEDEARRTIDIYRKGGFDSEEVFPGVFLVDIPVGEEFEWICGLYARKYGIIEYVEVNAIGMGG